MSRGRGRGGDAEAKEELRNASIDVGGGEDGLVVIVTVIVVVVGNAGHVTNVAADALVVQGVFTMPALLLKLL